MLPLAAVIVPATLDRCGDRVLERAGRSRRADRRSRRRHRRGLSGAHADLGRRSASRCRRERAPRARRWSSCSRCGSRTRSSCRRWRWPPRSGSIRRRRRSSSPRRSQDEKDSWPIVGRARRPRDGALPRRRIRIDDGAGQRGSGGAARIGGGRDRALRSPLRRAVPALCSSRRATYERAGAIAPTLAARVAVDGVCRHRRSARSRVRRGRVALSRPRC